jgi:hypothetical protein
MTTRRIPDTSPPVAIEYAIDANDEPVPVRFYDLTTSPNEDPESAAVIFTTIDPDLKYPRAVFDPARVTSECEAIWAADIARAGG